ncbi:PREDICTED: RNA-binding protein MEX3D-like [Thamnophis sirtalis]|uniref:RNA-binding protein MEX3D-like n=1 Tax=Thamnophis sirtalis TaxID=35019 RepID=A0A6I9Z0G0_9SAUR|nr:PREDICTED: RNA-binding protein MEX3D-like [Thamnophis sirtalis]
MPSAIYQLDGEASRCCPPPGLGGLLTPHQIAQQPACSGSGFALPAGPEQPSLEPPSPPLLQEAQAPRDPAAELSLAFEQLSILGLAEEEEEEEEEEEGEGGREREEEEAREDGGRRGGGGGPRPEDDLMEAGDPGGLDPFSYHGLPPLAAAPPAGGGGLVLLEAEGSPPASNCASPVEILGAFPPHLGHPAPPQHPLLAGQLGIIGSRKKSVNMTECVSVPSSEHVAEIVGRQAKV